MPTGKCLEEKTEQSLADLRKVMDTFLGMQVEEKVALQLLPWDGAMEDAMQAAGYNPFLELTCRQGGALHFWVVFSCLCKSVQT